jgi:shikimate dehydrogenase
MNRGPYAEVIGDPIAHSRSPAIHDFWLTRLGLDAAFRATRVAPEALAAYFEVRRADPDWRGCNITIPHKQAALACVDQIEDGGIGAINCVLPRKGRLIGRNTDMGGLDAALPETLAPGERVVLVGAGGAAAAAIAALKGRGVGCDLIVRSRDQGRVLLDRLDADGRVFTFAETSDAIAGTCGLINASPLGMNGFPDMPANVLATLDRIRSGGFVLDMVYAPLRTPLLEAAERAGLARIDGLSMLIGQAALAFHFFFGAEAPRDADDALRTMLVQ